MLGSIGVIWSGVKALNIYIQVELSELPLFLYNLFIISFLLCSEKGFVFMIFIKAHFLL